MTGRPTVRAAVHVAVHAAVRLAVCAAAVPLALGGCAAYYYGDAYAGRSGGAAAVRTDTVAANYQAAVRLSAAAALDRKRPVRVTALTQSVALSPLGVPLQSDRLCRLFSRQLAGGLAQQGLQVWDGVDGDAALPPREPYDAGVQAVLVGTCAPAADTVAVSARLVSPASGAVLAAVDYAVPLDADLRELLR